MSFFSALKNIATMPIRLLRYKTASEITKERAIKLGILCRKSWVFFPPLFLYQYIRQTDKEMFTTEQFYKTSSSSDSRAFYNPSRPRDYKNWKVQNDLALLSLAAEKNN